MVRPLFFTTCNFPILSILLERLGETELQHYTTTLHTWTPKLKHGDQTVLSKIQKLSADVYKCASVPRVLDSDRERYENCWISTQRAADWSRAEPECRACYAMLGGHVEVDAPHARWTIAFGDAWRPVELRRGIKVGDTFVFGEMGLGRKNWRHYEEDIWWGADWQENRVMAELEKVRADVVCRSAGGAFEPPGDVQRLCAAIKEEYSYRVL
ncbi:hypothetical protein B0A48_11119 [Cryoendolithus antarcticus]|uniref:Uncharacterized protein n=1 Tax=Cryoendolithus antarcticus TaxID=1507870 RepID=A0A1V8SUK4_9PEZI|nr:hypothetical protein B0A48_11119 [Cryoendolithus antarcticus]